MNAEIEIGSQTPLVVAVTGGIASGKSALTARFEALGVPVADADAAARAVVEPGTTALAEIVETFGDEVLTADGRLDRRALRARVFANESERRRLEAIVHPRVREWLAAAVSSWRTSYGLLSVPLLAENAAAYRWVDRVLVVDVAPEVQIERLIKRDDVDRALAEAMLAAQVTREQRLAIADDVHDASGSIDALPARVAELHARYLELAQAKREDRLPVPRIRRV
jgi:dephospho-CoA kinase